MNILEYIEKNWNSTTGLDVTLKSGRKTRRLCVPDSNKWDVWLWGGRGGGGRLGDAREESTQKAFDGWEVDGREVVCG